MRPPTQAPVTARDTGSHNEDEAARSSARLAPVAPTAESGLGAGPQETCCSEPGRPPPSCSLALPSAPLTYTPLICAPLTCGPLTCPPRLRPPPPEPPHLRPLPIVFVLAGESCLLKALQDLADTPGWVGQHWLQGDPWDGGEGALGRMAAKGCSSQRLLPACGSATCRAWVTFSQGVWLSPLP